MGRSPRTAADAPVGLSRYANRVRGKPDQGVRRGRGLPTVCQEFFNSEEDHFFEWGLCPQTPGIYRFFFARMDLF
jgi:hypothetical protein